MGFYYCIVRGGSDDDDSAHVLADLPRLAVALCFSRPARTLAGLEPAECRTNRAKLFRLTGVLAREPGFFEKAGTVGFLCLVFPFLLSCSLIPPASGVVDTGTNSDPCPSSSSCLGLGFSFRLMGGIVWERVPKSLSSTEPWQIEFTCTAPR